MQNRCISNRMILRLFTNLPDFEALHAVSETVGGILDLLRNDYSPNEFK